MKQQKVNVSFEFFPPKNSLGAVFSCPLVLPCLWASRCCFSLPLLSFHLLLVSFPLLYDADTSPSQEGGAGGFPLLAVVTFGVPAVLHQARICYRNHSTQITHQSAAPAARGKAAALLHT